MEMHRSHEILAGIKCFFVSSVYGLALGIGLGGGIDERAFGNGESQAARTLSHADLIAGGRLPPGNALAEINSFSRCGKKRQCRQAERLPEETAH